MDNSFELEVKSKLGWTLKQWQAEGNKGKGMRRLINSLKFWSGRLHNAKRDNNVILTFYDGEKKVYPSLQKIAEKIFSFNEQIDIIGYAKFKNRHFISLSFGDLIMKDFVTQNLIEIESSKIAFLHWVDEAIQQSITVDWLSDSTDLDLTIQYIAQYMEINSVQREATTLPNGNVCTSGKVFFHGKIKDNIQADDIPHFAYIDGLECLIIVEGRPYKCFTCFKVGHKAIQCTRAFCRVCKTIISRIHTCAGFGNNMLQQNNVIEQTNTHSQEGEEVGEEMSDIRSSMIGNTGKEKLPTRNLFLNLFQNNELPVCKDAVNKVECVESVGWPQNILSEDGIASLATPHKVANSWFNSVFDSHKLDKAKINDFITEETYAGDPNFVLLDTSTEESDSDSELNINILDEAQLSMFNLTKSANLARSFIDESSVFLKPIVEEKRARLEDLKEERKESMTAEYPKSNAVNFNTESKEEIESTAQFGLDIHISKKSVTSKKKRKNRK